MSKQAVLPIPELIEPDDDKVEKVYYEDFYGNIDEKREYHWCDICNSNHRYKGSACNPKELARWIERKAEMDADHLEFEREQAYLKSLIPVLEKLNLGLEISHEEYYLEVRATPPKTFQLKKSKI